MEKYCEQVATRSFLPSPPRRVKSFPRFPRSTCSFVATKNARPGFLIRHRRLSVFFFFFFHYPTPFSFHFLLSVATVPNIALFCTKVEWKE